MVDVDHLADRQALHPALGLRRHRIGDGLDGGRMKARQEGAPRLLVVAPVDREEAVAEQRPEVAEPALAPLERVGIGHEDLVGRLRAHRPHHRLVRNARREHRPMLGREIEQHAERVLERPQRRRDAQPVVAGRQVHASAPAPLDAQIAGDLPTDPGIERRRRGRRERPRAFGRAGGHGATTFI